jgi:hypothetical protein
MTSHNQGETHQIKNKIDTTNICNIYIDSSRLLDKKSKQNTRAYVKEKEKKYVTKSEKLKKIQAKALVCNELVV